MSSCVTDSCFLLHGEPPAVPATLASCLASVAEEASLLVAWCVARLREEAHRHPLSSTYADAVEEALCFGWIDSLVHPIDDSLYRQVFTPRKPKSAWSAVNRKRVERLIEAGLMTAAGMAMISWRKRRDAGRRTRQRSR